MKRLSAAAPYLFAIIWTMFGPGRETGFAQRGFVTSSIELSTASADIVVLAPIVDLAFKDCPPKKGETKSEWQWVTVTLKVQSTLKGKVPQNLMFVGEVYRDDTLLSTAKQSGQSFLWFMKDAGTEKEKLPPEFPVLPKDQPRLKKLESIELGSAARGKKIPLPLFSMDFQVLNDEDKIIDAVKAEVARKDKGPVNYMMITIPRAVADRLGKHRSGDANGMLVPINARLEELAQVWVRSKEDWLREAGVKALHDFKSNANAASLMRLLDDPASHITTNEDGIEERVYYIRKAAYETLVEWKVSVLPPKWR
jgi:hypothetical protein